ncbi:MAG TPA: isochorismate synthase, partial [Candidatus Synoicihabitans sp.]|nr:isochorismate synthase [Candidatus Synoicihabitans sp.]
EPHFYAERPMLATALAGAEIAVAAQASGPARFATVQQFIDDTLAHTIAVGDVEAPFGGPHFFTAFSFLDEVEPGEAFPAAQVFVPRWQVARAGGVTTAVANLVVAPDADLAPLTERVWRAHAKFRRFDFAEAGSMGEGGSIGVPPMGSVTEQHGRDAHATDNPPGRDAHATKEGRSQGLGPLHVRRGAHLPHWTREHGIYAVTFRLADSLPQTVLAAWEAEREEIARRAEQQGRHLSPAEQERLRELHSERVEAYLDSGVGACYLSDDRIAGEVVAALRHFDGERYALHAWCVMPNHVHVIVHPFPGYKLDEILHSWKSYTAKRANQHRGEGGQFWQRESYDHLVRDESDYARLTRYVLENPTNAGLANWRWVGTGSMGVPPMGSVTEQHGRDAHATSNPPERDAHATVTVRETGDYRAAVTAALSRISRGEVRKVVLARALEVQAPEPLHPLRILNGLRQRFPECYAFSIANGRGDSFIGASPERLGRVSRGVLETDALAGTARRGAGAAEDAALGAALLRSEKDRREQQLVLEAIRRRLEPLGLALEHPAEPSLLRLANVQHLHTPVRARLPDQVRLLEVLARLHPTPAVGGTPREAAVAAIQQLEGFSRGLYAGALGWINARGGGEFFVGIRSALVRGERARVYAGAGIVAGSDADREFVETELKFRALLDALLNP